MSTIRDVARRAGVSIATVSRILNNDEYFGVTAETKQRVLEAVKELNYKKKKYKKKKYAVKYFNYKVIWWKDRKWGSIFCIIEAGFGICVEEKRDKK